MSASISYTDNSAAGDKFISVTVNADKIIKSWTLSILAHEWLDGSGKLKPAQSLSASNQEKLHTALQAIKDGQPLVKPILGVGIMDNVEIGSGRAEFAALYQSGIKTIEAHIPKSNQPDFKDFLI